uniref:Uncharacterized protein n=1 Tax=Micrurus corallinus TaxID=54390 RepID=A0A2D4FAV9_MICCO
MIHFCLAHAAYHFSRWLPKHLRFRLQLVIFALGIAILLLQFYVLLRPKSSHYCNQPLLYNLVGSIILTFFATGLALILAMTQHIPWELRATISIFGLASFAEGAYITLLTALAPQCPIFPSWDYSGLPMSFLLD